MVASIMSMPCAAQMQKVRIKLHHKMCRMMKQVDCYALRTMVLWQTFLLFDAYFKRP